MSCVAQVHEHDLICRLALTGPCATHENCKFFSVPRNCHALQQSRWWSCSRNDLGIAPSRWNPGKISQGITAVGIDPLSIRGTHPQVVVSALTGGADGKKVATLFIGAPNIHGFFVKHPAQVNISNAAT